MIERKTNQIESKIMNIQGIIHHLDYFSQQIKNNIKSITYRIFNIYFPQNKSGRFFFINNFKQIKLSRGIL